MKRGYEDWGTRRHEGFSSYPTISLSSLSPYCVDFSLVGVCSSWTLAHRCHFLITFIFNVRNNEIEILSISKDQLFNLKKMYIYGYVILLY
jgi:hypothetical protein